MIRTTHIKLIRDLWQHRVPCFTIAMIVACGVASQITAFSLIETLRQGMHDYYEQSGFSDLFVRVNPLRLSATKELRSIPGIVTFQPRIVLDASLQISGEPVDPSIVTLIGTPPDSQEAANRAVVRQGMPLAELPPGHVLISEVFAQARRLKIGDTIDVSIRGLQHRWVIAGIAISPEYLFQIREGAGVPDNRRYAVAWLRYDDLARATGLTGAFNNLTINIEPGVSLPVVEQQVRRALGSSNILNCQRREFQISHRYTNNAVSQLYSVAIVPPMLFLAVAAFLIYIALSRLMKMERENIAMQRAFGYTSLEVARHYLAFIAIVMIVGCILGDILGVALTSQALGMYREIYRFPSLPLRVSIPSVFYASGASLLAGLLGGVVTIWIAASLPPAIGLRPEPPSSYQHTWLDQLANLLKLGPVGRMVLRSLGRWKLRTCLATFGIALGMGVMILGSYTQNAVDYVIDFEFHFTRHYDAMLQFAPGTSDQAIDEVSRLPGVMHCEPYIAESFAIRSGHRERTVNVLGLAPDALIQPVRENLLPIGERRSGIAISQALADALQVRLGSRIEIVSLDTHPKEVSVFVDTIVHDFSGLNAYADIADLRQWFDNHPFHRGGLLTIDSDQKETLLQEWNRRPGIQSIAFKAAALESFKTNDSKNLLLFRVFNILFSTVIGVGAVYAIASIAMVEHQDDMALMRVLGYSNLETALVLIGSLIMMVCMAIPIGCATGFGFANLATSMLNTESQRIPVLVSAATYASAVLVSLVSFGISVVLILRSIYQMDCLAILKRKD